MEDTPESLVEALCDYFKMPLSRLKERTRRPEVVYVRHLAFYLLRKKYRYLSYKGIGEFFSTADHKWDHTSVMHGVHTIEDRMDNKGEAHIKRDIITFLGNEAIQKENDY